jgi:hypothetical protein
VEILYFVGCPVGMHTNYFTVLTQKQRVVQPAATPLTWRCSGFQGEFMYLHTLCSYAYTDLFYMYIYIYKRHNVYLEYPSL